MSEFRSKTEKNALAEMAKVAKVLPFMPLLPVQKFCKKNAQFSVFFFLSRN